MQKRNQMMKKMLMAWTIMMGMCLSMHAQDEDYSIPVNFKGERPTITDFVSALLSQEELGEYLGNLSDQWKLRQQGKKTKGAWTVNTANGYVRYEEINMVDGMRDENTCEFCYWNCADNRHKLFATSVRLIWDGRPVDTEHSGLSFYIYDSKTRRMNWASTQDLGVDIDVPGREVAQFSLPITDKNIIATAFPSDEYKGKTEIVIDCQWDGMRFHQKSKYGQKLSFKDGPIGPKETWEDYDVSLRIVDANGANPGYEAIVRNRDGKIFQVLETKVEDRPGDMAKFGNVIEKDVNFDGTPDLLICLGGQKVTDQTFLYYDAWIADWNEGNVTFTLYPSFRDIANAEVDAAYRCIFSHYMARDGSYTYLQKSWSNGKLVEDGKSWNVKQKLER